MEVRIESLVSLPSSHILLCVLVSKTSNLLSRGSTLRCTSALLEAMAEASQLLPQFQTLFCILLLLYNILNLLLLEGALAPSIDDEAVVVNVDILDGLDVKDGAIFTTLGLSVNQLLIRVLGGATGIAYQYFFAFL
jgi:hypothetical protein